MSRIIAVVACGFTVAACSALPSLDFLKSSPPTAALRFESEPPGAEVKASGQTCRTPCELTSKLVPSFRRHLRSRATNRRPSQYAQNREYFLPLGSFPTPSMQIFGRSLHRPRNG